MAAHSGLFQSFTTLTEKVLQLIHETPCGLTSPHGCPLVSCATVVLKMPRDVGAGAQGVQLPPPTLKQGGHVPQLFPHGNQRY